MTRNPKAKIVNVENKTEKPTADQIRNCKSMGWEYIGDGLFIKGDVIGYFVNRNFVKV